MKISFWIPAVVLYIVRVVFSNSVQVGTVLFTTTDLVKRCWTESDKSLLKARLIMQDVLPDPDCIDFSKPEAAVILLDYFHACYQIISTSTYGRVQNLMYLALSDALGGYLRAYVLPFTRRAYYAGQMKYSEAKKLFQLYDDIRLFLKTSGVGWAEPQKICYRKFRVKPLVITGGSLEACNMLYTIGKTSIQLKWGNCSWPMPSPRKENHIFSRNTLQVQESSYPLKIIEMEGKLHCINPVNNCAFQTDDPALHFSKNSEESFREDSGASEPPSRPCNSSSPACEGTPRHDLPLRKATTTNPGFYKSLPHDLVPTNRTQQILRDRDNVAIRKSRSGNVFHRKVAPLDAKRVIIPLPVLDDCGAPHSIAVPFRKRPLRNLGTRNSAFILEYYYLAVIKCFVAKGNSRTDIKNFNAQFHAWLVSQVFPRLNDEKWYPAFGGVLRVMETIRKFGAETTVKDPILHDIAYLFGKGAEFTITEGPRLTGKDKVREVAEVEDCYTLPRRHYLTAVLLVSLIWIFIFCTCAFYCQATRGRNLLYEGCSEASSYSRGRRGIAEKDRFIDFQFLVKFFKKKDSLHSKEQVYHCFVENEKEKKIIQGSFTRDTKPKETCQCTEQSNESLERKPKERGRLTLTGQGDVPPFLIHKSDNMQRHQQIRPSGLRLPPSQCEKTELRDRQAELGWNDVQLLWKKPSVKFKRNALKDGEKAKERFEWTLRDTKATMKRSDDLFSKTSSHSCSASVEDETKGSSTEKRSSTCSCSESCQHSNTTSTNSSSQTQVENKLSATTMQFFERVIARHEPCRKSSTQESTAESESEGADSYSSESDS